MEPSLVLLCAQAITWIFDYRDLQVRNTVEIHLKIMANVMTKEYYGSKYVPDQETCFNCNSSVEMERKLVLSYVRSFKVRQVCKAILQLQWCKKSVSSSVFNLRPFCMCWIPCMFWSGLCTDFTNSSHPWNHQSNYESIIQHNYI